MTQGCGWKRALPEGEVGGQSQVRGPWAQEESWLIDLPACPPHCLEGRVGCSVSGVRGRAVEAGALWLLVTTIPPGGCPDHPTFLPATHL